MPLGAVTAAEGAHWVQPPDWIRGACEEQLFPQLTFPMWIHVQAVISEMFGFCLHCRVFWGMRDMVIAMVSDLCGDFQAGLFVILCQ